MISEAPQNLCTGTLEPSTLESRSWLLQRDFPPKGVSAHTLGQIMSPFAAGIDSRFGWDAAWCGHFSSERLSVLPVDKYVTALWCPPTFEPRVGVTRGLGIAVW